MTVHTGKLAETKVDAGVGVTGIEDRGLHERRARVEEEGEVAGHDPYAATCYLGDLREELSLGR